MPTNIFKKGHTGVISRSGTLTYEVVYNLTQAGLGQSTAVGVGGDPVVGLYFEELLRMFQDDQRQIVLHSLERLEVMLKSVQLSLSKSMLQSL